MQGNVVDLGHTKYKLIGNHGEVLNAKTGVVVVVGVTREEY